MKKFRTSLLAALLVVCFSAIGFAGYHGFGGGMGHGPVRQDRNQMTEQQKKEHIEFMAEKNKLREAFLRGEVKAGRMSNAEAEAHITLMNEHLKRMKDANFERPVMTDEQKEAIKQYRDKVRALEIEYIKKGMASGSISQERGERMIQRLENPGEFKEGSGRNNGRGYHYRGGWNQ